MLLHITSLPGADKQGNLGQDAYNFVNFLHNSGVSVWQTLPLGMTHADGSPYQCLSAHAGNPTLIDTDGLVALNWLNPEDQCTECKGFHDEPQCAAVCPVDCCIPDDNHVESEETLLNRQAFLHNE